MATSTKLVADLGVLLRGMRSHEGTVAARATQARTKKVGTSLGRTADHEQRLTADLGQELTGLGMPLPRIRPSWVPSPTAVAGAVAGLAQPLGEALVLEAAAVRTLADRAQVARGLATALGHTQVAQLTGETADLYRGYADWLVETAAVLVVDEDAADLVPTATQRVAGRAKDLVGVPARLAERGASRVAALVP